MIRLLAGRLVQIVVTLAVVMEKSLRSTSVWGHWPPEYVAPLGMAYTTAAALIGLHGVVKLDTMSWNLASSDLVA